MLKGIQRDALFRFHPLILPETDSRIFFGIVLAGIILFAVFQTWPYLDLNLKVDEPYTANLVHLPLSQMWDEFQRVGYEIAYHLPLKVWVTVFGETEFTLRSLSLLFYSLTIVTVGFTARRLVGWQGGLIAAFLLSISTHLGILHAANTRPYALLGLQVALATLVSLHLMELIPPGNRITLNRRVGLSLLLVVLHLFGLMNHPIYLFYLVAICVAAILLSARVGGLLTLCGIAGLAADLLLWGPAFSVTLPASINWIQVPTLQTLLDAYLHLWGNEKTLVVGGYIVVLSIVRRRLAKSVYTDKAALVMLVTVIASGILAFGVSQFRPVFHSGRTPMIILPAACLLAAILITRLGYRWLTAVFVAALMVGATVHWTQARARPDPFPTMASLAYVSAQSRCGDTLILGSLSYSGVEYYWRRLGAPDCVQREPFPLSTLNHPGWMDTDMLLKQRAELAEEARATVERLAAQPGASVWLFYIRAPGAYREVTDIVRHELEQRFTLSETLELTGLYFDSVLVYSPR